MANLGNISYNRNASLCVCVCIHTHILTRAHTHTHTPASVDELPLYLIENQAREEWVDGWKYL